MKRSLILLVLLIVLAGSTNAQGPDLPVVGSRGCAQDEVEEYLWARKALLNAGKSLVNYIADDRMTPTEAVVVSSVLGHAIYLLSYPDCLVDLQLDTLASVIAMNEMYSCVELQRQSCMDNVKGFLDDLTASRDPILKSVYRQVGIDEGSELFQTIMPEGWDLDSWIAQREVPTPSGT